MILSELKGYLCANRVVSMDMLLTHFAIDQEIISEMLAIWMRKGNVRKIENIDPGSLDCARVYSPTAELYEWIDKS
jgi:hypothetical protein